MPIWEPFERLRRRNKVLFTVIVSLGVILFWKGTWALMDILIDRWLFGGLIDKIILGGSGELHLFWSNVLAASLGIAILTLSGLVLQKLA